MDLDDLAHAQAAVAALVADLAPGDWDRATPCEAWDVAGVVRHLHVGEQAFTVALGRTTYDLAALTAAAAGLGPTDLPASYGAGATALRAALASAEPTASYPTGIGPMPPAAIAELRTIEALAHGWDVARGTDRALVVDDAVAERAIAHSLTLMERLPPERQVFGTPQPVADNAVALDRLVALLGRTV